MQRHSVLPLTALCILIWSTVHLQQDKFPHFSHKNSDNVYKNMKNHAFDWAWPAAARKHWDTSTFSYPDLVYYARKSNCKLKQALPTRMSWQTVTKLLRICRLGECSNSLRIKWTLINISQSCNRSSQTSFILSTFCTQAKYSFLSIAVNALDILLYIEVSPGFFLGGYNFFTLSNLDQKFLHLP